MRRSQLKWKAATEPQPKSTCAEFQRKLTAAAEPQPKPKAFSAYRIWEETSHDSHLR